MKNKDTLSWGNSRVFEDTKSMLEEILRLDESVEINAYGIIEGGKNVRAPYIKIDGFNQAKRCFFKAKIFHPKGVQRLDIFCDLTKARYIKRYIESNFIKEVVYKELSNKK